MNVGILWDIENVTPPTGTNYIQSVLEAVSEDGRISYAMAFGNWNNNAIKNIAYELSVNNFELIHIPRSDDNKKKKNSADMSLVAHGVELIFQFPHIDRFVLITGDADFRPLILALKKHGKETWVICDAKNNASEDLLKMADKYLDYREILNIDEPIDEVEINGEESIVNVVDEDIEQLSKEQFFQLFKEAIIITINEGKKPSSGGIKIKMKLLNNQFNENKLGYNTWNDFVLDAIKNTDVKYDRGFFSTSNDVNNVLPDVFQKLLNELTDPKEWVLFTKIAPKINCRKYGYKKFKTLALDAEKRGYIQTKNDGLIWSMKKMSNANYQNISRKPVFSSENLPKLHVLCNSLSPPLQPPSTEASSGIPVPALQTSCSRAMSYYLPLTAHCSPR
jgi:uncharacterized LabA/DUF88 family protein